MKTIHILTAALLLAACNVHAQTPAAAAPTITAAELKAIPTVDLADLTMKELDGRIVRLRFAWRSAKPLVEKDGRKIAQIAQVKGGKVYEVRVELPLEGEKWYHALPVGAGLLPRTIIVRLVQPINPSEVSPLMLLGVDMRTGAKGPEFVW